ncbi:unnamed protein product [Heligmosomoides polygyrus]|uniref:BPTI/Kunitz inhibitor domain-containing protein n=1 Tax=Heligmosomoides polygyrus TaxID=6339 RepID=A0A3P8DH64_HELPZ|nr:unnamed protein product [Heligmosomoides polygyrus]
MGSEWEDGRVRKRTKKPRNRKGALTTTNRPTTTTMRPSSHGLPQCNDPSNSAFIDVGNRLRDCYFQRCERGYNCEFNKRIRRFICCGQDLGLVPPPGLPMLPAPKPLNPRGLRPNTRPFPMMNDGAADLYSRAKYSPKPPCCERNNCASERLRSGCQTDNVRCPSEQSGSRSGCRQSMPGDYRAEGLRQPQALRRSWFGNGCSTKPGGCAELEAVEGGPSLGSKWPERSVGPSDSVPHGCSATFAAKGCQNDQTRGTHSSPTLGQAFEAPSWKAGTAAPPFELPGIQQTSYHPMKKGMSSLGQKMAFAGGPFRERKGGDSPLLPLQKSLEGIHLVDASAGARLPPQGKPYPVSPALHVYSRLAPLTGPSSLFSLQLREQRLLPEFAPTLLGLDVASVPRLLRCPHLAAQLLDAAAPLQTPLRSAN